MTAARAHIPMVDTAGPIGRTAATACGRGMRPTVMQGQGQDAAAQATTGAAH